MRCFIAIDLDKSLKLKLRDIQRKLEGDIKIVPQENLHITLKFLGNVNENKITQIKNIIKNTCSKFKKFQMNIKGIGCFPNNNYIRVVWAGAESKTFYDIAVAIDNKLKELGFEKEKNHAPHITLARVKSANHNIKEILEKFKNTDFGILIVSEISLFKSTLTKDGSVYEKIYSVKLT